MASKEEHPNDKLMRLHKEYMAIKKRFEDEQDPEKKKTLYNQCRAKLNEMNRVSGARWRDR